jgi:hypothetical protein
MLSTPLHLARLFNNARQILDERATGKLKSKKEFRVILVDQHTGKKATKTNEEKKVSFGMKDHARWWSESGGLRSRRSRRTQHDKALIPRRIMIVTVMLMLHRRRKLACNMSSSCKQNMPVVTILANTV